ncbi:MAG: hypothetical protein LBU32_09005 [Clostridiales bacterium]|jgi:hypothetical protein|nr:hypothetical protein [Clostridiales bacterium]
MQVSAEGRTFQRLSPFERGEIKALLREGPGVSAHEKSRKNCRKPLKIAERPDFMAFAGEKPGEGRPPDAAAGREKLEPELSGKPALCAKVPCNCIDPGVMPIKNIDLALKARRKPKSEKARRSGRALGAGVEGRPGAAGAREESVHWEIGSAAGKKSGKPAVPATVERKARSQIAAEPGGWEGCRKLRRGGRRRLQKRPGGDGREFAGRGRAVYFRHPHSSFEKGAGERRSGLPRRFAEKRGSAGGMPAALIAKAADWSNNLPR